MVITPRHESIAGLFGPTRIFRVPKYQRHYAWTAEEIDDLKADLDASLKARKALQNRPHFFWGLVTVAKPHNGSAAKLEVVDGQQRLATFVMLVAQVINVMLALSTKLVADPDGALRKFLKEKAANLHSQFLRLDDTVALKVENLARLELSNPDYLFFVQLIQGNDPDDGAKGAPTCKDKSRVLDFANTILEHIYPQNSATSDTQMDQVVQSLGNLTILGPMDNDAVGNKPFSQKKAVFAKSTLSLNVNISSVALWDVAAANARKEKLKAMALKIFVV